MYVPRTNDALRVNPPFPAQEHISWRGSNWLWTVFAVFALTGVTIAIWSVFVKSGRRAFHHLVLMILTISGAAYFAMASDLGFTTTPTEFSHYTPAGTLRQIFWVRYVDWILTFPLLLVTILFAADAPGADLAAAAFAGAFTWAAWLVAALVKSSYKWGFFTFGLVTLIWAMVVLLSATFRAPPTGLHVTGAAVAVAFLYLLYPVAFGLSEGGNVISPTAEAVFYGVLDLLIKPLLLFCVLAVVHEAGTDGLRWGFGHVGAASFENRGGQLVTAGAGTAAAVEVEKAQRGKMFTREGAHDAATPAAAAGATPGTQQAALPRHSEATLEGDIVHPAPYPPA